MEATADTVHTLYSVDPLGIQYIVMLCTLWHPGITILLGHWAAL